MRFPSPGEAGEGRHLLVQAGKQIEHLTGGLIRAGFHEVVVNEATVRAIEERKQNAPERPMIRISSTFFWHLNSDYDLVPIPELAERAAALSKANDEDSPPVYQPMKVGAQVQKCVFND